MQSEFDMDSGFVDVAANALAIVILMTMIALLIASIPLERGEEARNEPPPLPFPVALDPTVPPLNSYWYVSGAGLTRIELAEAATGIADGQRKVETEVGAFYFQNDRSSYRDLDEYRLDFLPSPPGIAALAESFDPDAQADWLRKFSGSFDATNTVPTFFVDPEAFQTFGLFFQAIRSEGIALRWRPIEPGQRAVFLRKPSQFESGLATWR